MDTIAHGLWSYAAGNARRKNPVWRWLVFFGTVPDLIWLPATAYNLIASGSIHFFIPFYNVSHSLVVFAACALVASLYRRRAAYVMWPWALHILIDIPGHIDLPTPFLWPLSNYSIHGWFDWLSLPWLIVNYAVLLFVIAGILLRDHDRRKLP